MPYKRRKAKALPSYPEPLLALLEGLPVAPSVEAKGVLLGVLYFNDWPELAGDAGLQSYALHVLHSWPADWDGEANAD